MGEPALHDDPLRGQLLEAATRVFAREGYAGAKILDIVREAGLSTGAVYGRFRSKEQLLREAVVSRSSRVVHVLPDQVARVADLINRAVGWREAPLTDDEAVRIEAFVTARRDPEVAGAIAEAQARWRNAVQPLVEKATHDGTVAAGVDPEAVLFFVQTMHLGLLVQRGAGTTGPDQDSWADLISRIVDSFGDAEARHADPTAVSGHVPDRP
ncbi:MAG TPA: helix-turn-helix domain-containing protein [Acidimicrobiales bacterium]|nr:helix-turn-helix domain-containing protein [Acidimicrobiales bacterium]